jgi:citrate lyase subunit beta/citryl-CoA lyase
MLQKAAGIDADEIVIDLEDAVIPERKADALDAVVKALDAPFAARRVSVRVNAVGSPWIHTELIALVSAPGQLDSIVVPKVENAGDLAFVERLISGAGAAAETPVDRLPRIQALIETASGFTNLAEICGSSPLLETLILGYADLSVSLGRSPAGRDDLDRWLAIQDGVLVAARTAGLGAIDGPHLVIDDTAGLAKAADQARVRPDRRAGRARAPGARHARPGGGRRRRCRQARRRDARRARPAGGASDPRPGGSAGSRMTRSPSHKTRPDAEGRCA